MILPDVNVLVYAFRRDADRHTACRAWLDKLVNGDEAYGMAPQLLASFVRIVTHPRVYVHPSSVREASILRSGPRTRPLHQRSRR